MGHPLFDLTGRLALVTGSSKGIGFALAEGLAQAGASIVLNGRDEERLDKAVAELKSKGYEVSPLAFNAAEPTSVAAAFEKLASDGGALDILINNAGMQHRTPLEDFPYERWRELFRVNVDSAFVTGQAAARGMIARGRGKIVNIASVQSELARPGIAPYTATKGAIRNLTRGMATDWAKHGLQVNAIAPGYFRTELNQALVDDAEFSAWLAKHTPAGRWGNVGELVGAALFLASDASSFVNGLTLYVDGGITASL